MDKSRHTRLQVRMWTTYRQPPICNLHMPISYRMSRWKLCSACLGRTIEPTTGNTIVSNSIVTSFFLNKLHYKLPLKSIFFFQLLSMSGWEEVGLFHLWFSNLLLFWFYHKITTRILQCSFWFINWMSDN